MSEQERIAPVFMNEGSQVVRLPREFRFEGSSVRIRREGRAVILEPLQRACWPVGYWERLAELGPAPDDFVVPEALPPSPERDQVLRGLNRAPGS